MAERTLPLLSDRFRFVKISLLLATLGSLCWLSHRWNSEQTATYFGHIPPGGRRTLAHFEVVALSDGAMTVRLPDGRFPLRVRPAPEGTRVGDIVNLEVIRRGGQLVVAHSEVRKLRKLKIWVSIPVLVVVMLLLRRAYCLDVSRFVFQPRPAREGKDA